MKCSFDHLRWKEITFLRPIEPREAIDLFTHLAGLTQRKSLIWEIRSSKGKLHYLLGFEHKDFPAIKKLFQAHEKFFFSDHTTIKRPSSNQAKEIRFSSQSLPLKVKESENFLRVMLATIANNQTAEEIVLQLVIGTSYSPRQLSNNPPNPNTTLFQALTGNIPPMATYTKKQLLDKSALPQFACTFRIGIRSHNRQTAFQTFHALVSCLKMLETSETRVRTKEISTQKMDEAFVPWQPPLRLSTFELATLCLIPSGSENLKGLLQLHPKPILAPLGLNQNHERFFGETTTLNGALTPKKLGISSADSLYHTILTGATGSGKSNVILHLALRDLHSGNSTLVLDPKGDLIRDILERFPKQRDKDLVILDPTQDSIISFNPFDLIKHGVSPELLTQYLMAIFQDLFADSWGIRSSDVLSYAILTLAKSNDSTLLMLPQILTNKPFRQQLLSQINDPLGVESFWHSFENLTEGERVQQIAPVLNKLRTIFIYPSLRHMFGQSTTTSSFSLSDLFYDRKVILISLNSGVLGADAARFVGSLVISLVWCLALGRAKIAPDKRHRISLFIDELQDYLKLPTDLTSALVQARSLGISLTLAHQHRHQLSQSIKMAIDANCHNKVCFGLDMNDATEMARLAPELEAEDFYSLAKFGIYTKLYNNGIKTKWLLGSTLPPPPKLRDYTELLLQNTVTFGRSSEDIEQEVASQFGLNEEDLSSASSPINTKAIGRRKRKTDKDR